VPTPFWDQARAALDSIKPVFMLAEAERKEHHLKAFDMSYGWEFMHITNQVAKGEKKLSDIDEYMAKQDTAFPRSSYRMYFTTNHDENSWNGTGFEQHASDHGRAGHDHWRHAVTLFRSGGRRAESRRYASPPLVLRERYRAVEQL